MVLKKEIDSTEIKKIIAEGYDTLYVPVYGIGDGLMFTAAAKYLSQKTGKKILVSHKNNELFLNNPYITPLEGFYDYTWDKEREKKFIELGLKVVYPTYWNFRYKKDGGHVLMYPQQHAIAEICAKAGCSGEIELKPEIYLSDEEKKFGRFAPKNKKQIAIMNTAIDKLKQWNNWQKVVDALKDEYCFVQIGAPTDKTLKNVIDKKGLSLRQAAAILYNSDLFVGQIGGLMHMARAVDCPAVILYSCAEPPYFVSYDYNKNIFPKKSCSLCRENKRDYYYEGCIKSQCDTCLIKPNTVIKTIKEKLNTPRSCSPQICKIIPQANTFMENYYLRMECKDYHFKKTITTSTLFGILPLFQTITTDKQNKKITFVYLFGILPILKFKRKIKLCSLK